LHARRLRFGDRESSGEHGENERNEGNGPPLGLLGIWGNPREYQSPCFIACSGRNPSRDKGERLDSSILVILAILAKKASVL
jgi:hypothetical protein